MIFANNIQTGDLLKYKDKIIYVFRRGDFFILRYCHDGEEDYLELEELQDSLDYSEHIWEHIKRKHNE